MKTWMVRAGTQGRFFERFRELNVVGIGWRDVGDLARWTSRDEITRQVSAAYPDFTEQQAVVAAGQLYRFAHEFQIGDRVVTYDTGGRRYLCGEITGPYHFDPTSEVEEFKNVRTVRWHHEKPRDELSAPAKSSLGALPTIFQVVTAVSAELWNQAVHKPSGASEPVTIAAEADASDLTYETVSEIASEGIKDRLTRLSGDQMEDLVAGVLRAMGYRTRKSAKGPDRGADILASPDGFGFQEPRIVVEVKHRPSQRMGAPDIRAFLGGRHARDKALYVSTGGFTTEARYEADRASIPTALWDFDELTETLLRVHPELDQETRQLIPLKPVYWTLDS